MHIFIAGVEYHLQQLADLRPAGVVLYHLDNARPPAVRHDVSPVPGCVWNGSGAAGLPERAASEPGRAVPWSAPSCHRGLRPEQLSPCTLCPPGGKGQFMDPFFVFVFDILHPWKEKYFDSSVFHVISKHTCKMIKQNYRITVDKSLYGRYTN